MPCRTRMWVSSSSTHNTNVPPPSTLALPAAGAVPTLLSSFGRRADGACSTARSSHPPAVQGQDHGEQFEQQHACSPKCSPVHAAMPSEACSLSVAFLHSCFVSSTAPVLQWLALTSSAPLVPYWPSSALSLYTYVSSCALTQPPAAAHCAT